jgi:hypothetical protein
MSAGREQLPPSVLAARNARASVRPTNGGTPRAYPDVVVDEDGDAAAVQLAATRALLAAATPEEVASIVATLVRDLGGGLLPARLDARGVALPLDVSLGLSEPKLAWAEPVSVAAMRLESVLPLFVEDARVALSRLQAQTRRPRKGGGL